MPKQPSDRPRPTLADKYPALAPYEGLIRFVIALLCANYFWKYTVLGDEGGLGVYWFGLDITAPFDLLADHIAAAVYGLLQFFGLDVRLINDTTMRFTETGTGIRIVWSCTALKQSFIWLVIILAARGPWRQKAWFIPMGWLCAYLFNILRLFLIALAMEHHPEWFEMLHTYLFKYLFYGMFFALWVWWDVKYSNVLPRNEA